MIAVVGVGSNLGDRISMIRRAVGFVVRVPGVVRFRVSPVYETEPVGPPQPTYLNAAVALEVVPPRSPIAIVGALLAIERDLGRIRGERFGPRTIDLDLLWTDGAPSTHPGAVVPHPRLHERAFALVPLLDVAPDAGAPDGTRYADLLATLPDGAMAGIARVHDFRAESFGPPA